MKIAKYRVIKALSTTDGRGLYANLIIDFHSDKAKELRKEKGLDFIEVDG